MLCSLCKSASELLDDDLAANTYCINLESIAEDGCQICNLLWTAVKIRQVDIDFGQDLRPIESFSRSRKDYYKIYARRKYGNLCFEHRSNGGYVTLLKFVCDSDNFHLRYMYDADSSDYFQSRRMHDPDDLDIDDERPNADKPSTSTASKQSLCIVRR